MRSWRLVVAGIAVLALGATELAAQRVAPRFTAELFGGLGTYGRFLEETVVLPTNAMTVILAERELTGDNAFTLGGAIGMRVLDGTTVRLSFTWANTNLEYEDDSGLDVDTLDEDDLADLSNWILAVEVLKFAMDERHRLSPYATGGVVVTWWTLDDDDTTEIISQHDTQFRFGGVGGLGLQYRATDRIGVRLEANIFALGNPFDGNDSYVTRATITGARDFPDDLGMVLKLDEPSTVRFSRFTIGVTYSFGDSRR